MSNDENKGWKPYPIPYPGSGAVRVNSGTGGNGDAASSNGWVPSSWVIGPGVAQSPSGQFYSSNGVSGSAPPTTGSVTVHSSGPVLPQESHALTRTRAAAVAKGKVKPENKPPGSHSGNRNNDTQDYSRRYSHPYTNLPPGTTSMPPQRPRSPTTVMRENEQVRKSCGGEGRPQNPGQR